MTDTDLPVGCLVGFRMSLPGDIFPLTGDELAGDVGLSSCTGLPVC